ncbi:MAG: hypothetical protein HYV42_05805 [Candidatus Magasanikbacteria bacterium]|nr:hypothetical protein [Candidatus Magasanikbacteria bacterium]
MLTPAKFNQPATPSLGRTDGFTLVEVVLYVTIATTFFVALVALLVMANNARVKIQTAIEVEEQGQLVARQITAALRRATRLNYPLPGAAGSAVSFDTADSNKNPTVIAATNGAWQITEGLAAAVPLTSPRVVVDSGQFINLARPGTSGSLRVQFTLSHRNPSGRREYSYSQTFYGAATLRP